MELLKLKIVLLAISLFAVDVSAQSTKITITVDGETELTATLVDNSSTAALIELLKEGPLTIEMHDYGNMEKVGPIGTTLPRNDEQITTEPGDIILYQGNALVIYYAPNSWNFTRLGKIDNISQEDLKAALGDGDVTVRLTLADTATNVENKTTGEALFRVYPNPVDRYLDVEGQFETLTLVNIDGQAIQQSQESRMDLSSIKSGVYFLNIKTLNDNIVTHKIVKRAL